MAGWQSIVRQPPNITKLLGAACGWSTIASAYDTPTPVTRNSGNMHDCGVTEQMSDYCQLWDGDPAEMRNIPWRHSARWYSASLTLLVHRAIPLGSILCFSLGEYICHGTSSMKPLGMQSRCYTYHSRTKQFCTASSLRSDYCVITCLGDCKWLRNGDDDSIQYYEDSAWKLQHDSNH